MFRQAGMVLLFLVLTVSFATRVTESMAGEDLSAVPPPQDVPGDVASQRLRLGQAVMAEKVDSLQPVRPAVAFSVGIGQVYCFTAFDPVPQPTVIFHRWYHRDELSTQTRLRLYPPKWSTYSVIQLRATDKGPWRVEISDQDGYVFNVLRFSITD